MIKGVTIASRICIVVRICYAPIRNNNVQLPLNKHGVLSTFIIFIIGKPKYSPVFTFIDNFNKQWCSKGLNYILLVLVVEVTNIDTMIKLIVIVLASTCSEFKIFYVHFLCQKWIYKNEMYPKYVLICMNFVI